MSKRAIAAICGLAGVVVFTPLALAAGEPLVSQGRQIVEEKHCRNCHSIGGSGVPGPGPNLNRVTDHRTEDWLRRWLRDPQTIEPGTLMPTFGFTGPRIDALIAFLGSLAAPEVSPSTSHKTSGDSSGFSLPLTKSWLAAALIALTLVAAWSMFERLGAPRRPWIGREAALLIHRINGYLFTALALTISQFCVRMLLRGDEEWSPRAAIHVAVAVIVLAVLGIKIALARRYSAGLGDLLPPLGITLLMATWILVAGSAGYYLVIATRH